MGATILAGALAVLAGLGAMVWHLNEQRGRYDPDTFCPLDGSESHTAILIDASDRLSGTQAKRVLEHVDDLRLGLQQHEWVGLYVLDERDVALPQPVFSLCNPGTGEAANPLYENPRKVARQFEQRFSGPLRVAVEALALRDAPEQATSPILEMVRAVALDRRYRSSGRRRLLVVSDMLHNMPQYSHYAGDFDFGGFARLPYARQFLEMSLLGVEVEVVYLKRPEAAGLQTLAHVRFWEEYFDAVDATLDRVEPML